MADWAKDPFIGVVSDVDVAQSAFGDFIPAFLNQCTPEDFDPDEYIIGKPDAAGIDTVVNYNAICLDHPLLIVEYGWNKAKKSTPIATNNDPIDGDFVDTLTTPPPPSEPDPNYQCDPAEHYTIIQGGLACERFEKGKRSEYYCKYTLTDGTPDGFPAGKKFTKMISVRPLIYGQNLDFQLSEDRYPFLDIIYTAPFMNMIGINSELKDHSPRSQMGLRQKLN